MENTDIHLSKGREDCKEFVCEHCDARYFSKSSLYNHTKLKHPQYLNGKLSKVFKTRCLELGCSFTAATIKSLHIHLHEVHGKSFTEEKLFFNTFDDFLSWKLKYERETMCFYCVINKAKNRITYHCNRSGRHRNHGHLKRKMKRQGSCKLGFNCTSTIQTQLLEDRSVQAVLFPYHYGHEAEWQHIRIPRQEREKIISRLKHKVPKKEILNDLQVSASEGSISRAHFLQKHDLFNMSAAVISDSDRIPEPEVKTLKKQIEELEEDDDVCILLFKNISEPFEPFDDDDFVLCVSSHYHLKLFSFYGSNIVCMDGTVETDERNFKLQVLLSTDEFGEGFIVAWMISNRSDAVAIEMFVAKVMEHYYNKSYTMPEATYFMSRKGLHHYNSWVNATQKQPKRLLCTWHVQKTWKEKLNRITDVNIRRNIYSSLILIMMQDDIQKATEMASSLEVSLLANHLTEDFAAYLKREWFSQNVFSKWAQCYLSNFEKRINVHSESFHRILNFLHLEGKFMKDLGRCINSLVEYSKDRLYYEEIKQMLFPYAYLEREIVKRHKAATRSEQSAVLHLCDDVSPVWTIQSSETGIKYTVEKSAVGCNSGDSCFSLCKDCNVCIHQWVCSCKDAALGITCKHLHLLCIMDMDSIVTNNEVIIENETKEGILECIPEIQVSCTSPKQDEGFLVEETITISEEPVTDDLRTMAKGLLATMLNSIDSVGEDVLQDVVHALEVANDLINTKETKEDLTCNLKVEF